ncbi:MAG: 16S rRNA pseudouridine(516) synthase [Lachnospiraceae bacterium]|nr:16S rRNA pseudouridine(516) synthase [Lachnospiraceae bacterium]
MRLDKYLADMHMGSRSEVKQLIRAGKVRLRGAVEKDPGAAVGEGDAVECEGRVLEHRKNFYYMLNKPAGILSATEDRNQKTVLDLFPEKLRRGLYPVGRLDKDTVGLLLITDDGALGHRLLSPAHHVDKRYFLRCDLPVTEEDAECFAKGMTLADGTELMPASLELSADGAVITIREGKYHQIKRMFAARGKEVVYLKRLSMGSLVLDPNLAEGEWRELTEEEIRSIKSE